MNYTRVTQRKFLVLLLALILLLLAHPLLRGVFDERILFDVLLTVVFLAALLVVFGSGGLRLVAAVLAIPTLLGVWTGYALPGLPPAPLYVGFHASAMLFFTFTVAVILRTVFLEVTVTADCLFGAFCAYLVTGLAFSHLYCIVEAMNPNSFCATGDYAAELHDQHKRYSLLVYFSFVTLTTVGYGDITPGAGARSWAVVEAILGQFFIAVLVAELIGKRASQVHAAKHPDPSAHAAEATGLGTHRTPQA